MISCGAFSPSFAGLDILITEELVDSGIRSDIAFSDARETSSMLTGEEIRSC